MAAGRHLVVPGKPLKELSLAPGRKHTSVFSEVVRNPTATAAEIITALGKRGIKVSRRTVHYTKRHMRLLGIELPPIIPRKKGRSVELGTPGAKIMRAVHEHPYFHNKEIVKLLGNEGVAVNCDMVSDIKSEMRRYGMQLSSERDLRAVENMLLTAEESAAWEKAKPKINTAIFLTSRRYNLNKETMEEFAAYVNRYMPGWIKGYKPEEGASLSTHLTSNVALSVRTFIKRRIKQQTALTFPEVELLGRLLKKTAEGGNGKRMSLQEAAIGEGIPFSKAEKIVGAYYSSRAISLDGRNEDKGKRFSGKKAK